MPQTNSHLANKPSVQSLLLPNIASKRPMRSVETWTIFLPLHTSAQQFGHFSKIRLASIETEKPESVEYAEELAEDQQVNTIFNEGHQNIDLSLQPKKIRPRFLKSGSPRNWNSVRGIRLPRLSVHSGKEKYHSIH